MKNCFYCNDLFDDGDLRPYGPNNEYICFDCGMRSENISSTQSKFNEMFRATLENANIVVLTPDGPKSPASAIFPDVSH